MSKFKRENNETFNHDMGCYAVGGFGIGTEGRGME